MLKRERGEKKWEERGKQEKLTGEEETKIRERKEQT